MHYLDDVHFQKMNNKGADQTVHMRSLINAFVVRMQKIRISHDLTQTYKVHPTIDLSLYNKFS